MAVVFHIEIDNQVSVLERTPARLLEEIILVDDHNEDATIGEELKVLDKVRNLFRLLFHGDLMFGIHPRSYCNARSTVIGYQGTELWSYSSQVNRPRCIYLVNIPVYS
jgi:hypothetical protein